MAKGKWRPEGWDRNIFSLKVAEGKTLKPHERKNALTTIKLGRESFEAGADSMLEALKKRGIDHRVYADHLRFGIDRGAALLSGNEGSIIYQGVKGTLVFIPDDD